MVRSASQTFCARNKSMGNRQEHLALFGLGTSADHSAIKAKYRELAKKYHPDVSPQSADTFRALTDAYHALLAAPSDSQPSTQGPAMHARWNIRRKHQPAEYPAWFKPPGSDSPSGSRGLSGFSRTFFCAMRHALTVHGTGPVRALFLRHA